MKNLSEYREELSAPRVPRSGGHDPFRFRKRVTDDGQKMRAQKEWKRHEPNEHRAASLRKLVLGRLPKRLAKFGGADFDLSETCEYNGDDGVAVKGEELAGIAAHIVRCAKHPVDYLFSLRNVPAKVIEPIKVYLRVKLAMGRLRAEIENATKSSANDCPREVFVLPKETLNQVQDDRKIPCPDKGDKNPPKFTWHASPAKVHDFKTLSKACGYDPRETSVYWIEKRANPLRRKWKTHGEKLRGESPAPKQRALPKSVPTADENTPPRVKHFTPADIDYNSVWPPVKMPDGPPKMAEPTGESMAEILVESRLKKEIIENGSATPEQDSCASEVSSVCSAKRGDDRISYSAETQAQICDDSGKLTNAPHRFQTNEPELIISPKHPNKTAPEKEIPHASQHPKPAPSYPQQQCLGDMIENEPPGFCGAKAGP